MALERSLTLWNGRGPVFRRTGILEVDAFDDVRMTLIGPPRRRMTQEADTQTVFYQGRWLTPLEKENRIKANTDAMDDSK